MAWLVETALTCVGVSAGCAFLTCAKRFFSWRHYDMSIVVGIVREGTLIYIFPFAWLAVYLASVWRRDSIIIGATPNKPIIKIISIQMLVLCGGVFIGTVIGITPLVVRAFHYSSASVFDILSLFTVLISICSLMCLAFSLACLLRVKLAVLLVPFALVFLFALPTMIDQLYLAHSGKSSKSIAWLWISSFPAYDIDLYWPTELFRIGYFLLLAFSCCFACACWVDINKYLQGIFWYGMPLVMAFSLVLVSPVLLARGEDKLECDSNGVYKTCFYPIDEYYVKEAEPKIAKVTELFPTEASQGLIFTQKDEYNVPKQINLFRVASSSRSQNKPSFLQQEQTETARYYAGDRACGHVSEQFSAKATQAILFWVYKQIKLGEDTPIAKYSIRYATDASKEEIFQGIKNLSRKEFKTWYLKNQTKIMKCQLTMSDLP